MNMKALILGIILLAAALIVPAFALYQQATTTMKAISQIPELANDPAGLNTYLDQQAVQQNTLLVIVIIVEVIIVAGFAVSFWYAIKCTSKDQCRNFAAPA